MKVALIAVAALSAVLVGCSPDAQRKAAVPVVETPASPPPKILLPLYAEVSNCLAECVSKWYRVPKDSSLTPPGFAPILPDSFADLMANPKEHDRFVAMIDQLPPRLGNSDPTTKRKPSHRTSVATSKRGQRSTAIYST